MNKALTILLSLLSVMVFASPENPGEPGKPDRNAESLFQTICSADEALELARKTDAVVFEGMRCTSGQEVWDAFYQTVSDGSPDSVLCAYYYVLDKEHMSEKLYEEEKDKYPQLFFYLVEYDGKQYSVKTRESTVKALDYQETFRYLLHFTGEAPASAAFSTYDNYVLVDDPSATWEGIMEGMFSSQSGAGYKHCTVYQNICDKSFSEEDGRAADDLNRSDVFRDISVRRFIDDGATGAIRQTVPGLEIQQEEPTPEEMAAPGDKTVWKSSLPEAGVGYRIDYLEKLDEQLGFEVFDKSILECYQDGDLLWTAEFTNFWVEDSLYTTVGTAVWGQNDTWSSTQPIYGWLARVDDKGTVLWEHRLSHGFDYESIAAVLDNGDGTWAVISRGDFNYLCLSQYDTDGNERLFQKTEVGKSGIWKAARLEDGYLVQMSHDPAFLVKLDHGGTVLDSFRYEGDDCLYYLTDMASFGGQLWLSAYAVPKQTDAGGRDEIANILNDVFERENWEISSEELTPALRDNYTAVLLLCDMESGVPTTFYSVKGSLGGPLSVNDAGQLQWDVESLTSAFFSPFTSSFTIGGTCKVFCYTFDVSGKILRQEDTGEAVPYRR